ncbi:hypothetical protein K501DRAFT_308589 [Backusella circina FSU 941]|nr:hypothetical protein K501DRAFT_308589 [Backusella circina FSU 941]
MRSTRGSVVTSIENTGSITEGVENTDAGLTTTQSTGTKTYLDETRKQSLTMKTGLKGVINLANSDVNNSFWQNIQDKLKIQGLITETRKEISSKTFRPAKYTDLRGDIHVSYFKDAERPELCYSRLNMSKVGFLSLEPIRSSDESKGFTGAIRTDGVGIDFICEKQVPKKSYPTTLASIKKDIGDNLKAVFWGLDLRIREVFVASDDIAKESHKVRRTSTAEYYQLAGSKKQIFTCSKYGTLHPQERVILVNSPTFEISSTTQFKDAAICISINFREITGYYDRKL